MLDGAQEANSSKSKENSSDAEAEPLPRRLGRLTLLKLMARGGMGEVFLATSGGIEGAERPAVVKVIRREHSEDRSFLARFLDEARIQAQLHHPGVAQILEATNDEDGKPYVVVEHVEGRNLGEVRQRAQQLGVRIAWPEAVALGLVLAEALMHVHERTDASGRPLEIVHRDLSPQNVMVGYGGDLKLIDFGTAKGENRRCHTISGIVFAKPGYVAPEVANQTPGGVPADLYAFGIMLWELVAGRRFLVGDAAQHLAAVAAHRCAPEPLSSATGCPPLLDAIIAKLTAPALEDRYSSARAAHADLLTVLQGAPSMSDGERGVRARIAHLMQRLWPAEPARSRAEFARLVARARELVPPSGRAPSPSPPPAGSGMPEPDLLAGTRWRLLGRLGEGSSGAVHEAVHADLGRRAAIKLLDAALVGSPEHERRFREEARVLASLRHPHLVELLDFGVTSEGRPFLALELLDGEPLDVRLRRLGPLPWREVAELGVQACRALAAAHAAGILHGDVKPQHLVLTARGLKLIDFGLSAEVAAAARGTGQEDALRVFGTPEYLAPECIGGAAGDVRSDLYALGVTLYELVTGTLPHLAHGTVALLEAKRSPLSQSAAERAPERGIPPIMDQIVTQTLEKDPAARPATADDLRERLEQALALPGVGAARRRKIGTVAIGALLAGALGLSGVVLTRADLRQSFAQRLGLAAPAPVAETAEPGTPTEAPEGAETVIEEGSGELAAEAPGPTREPLADEPTGDPGSDEEEGPVAVAAAPEPSAAPDLTQPAAAPSAAPEAPEAPAAPPVPACKGKRCVDLEAGLAEAASLIEKGQRIRGMQLIRRVGRNHGKDPRALRVWSETAAQQRAWGEALRVARQWAAVDPSAEAQIHLARMQRANGKPKDAVATLARLTAQDPQNQDARALLRLYTDAARVAKR